MAFTLGLAVGQALLAGGASFAFASAVVTALPTIALVGGSIAYNVVSSKRAAAAASGGRSVSDPRGLQQSVLDSAPEHMLGLGYATLAGKPFFIRGGEDLKPYFWVGVLLAAHECDGLDSVWINGTRVLIDPVTRLATSTPFNDGTTSFIEVSFRNGTLDQAIDPIIARDFPDIPSTFRQRGHATAVLKAHYGTGANRDAQEDKHKALYGEGQFTPLYRFRASKVYDPRGLNQSAGDPSTWTWTRNATLNIIHYLCWKFPGMRERIDWQAVARAADIDDEITFSKAGRAMARHTVDGAISDGDDAAGVIRSLLSANSGRLIRSASGLYIMPATKRSPVGTLHAGNLRGDIDYSRDLPLGETVNQVKAECIIPGASATGGGNFQMLPLPVIKDAAALAEDGQERAVSPQLTFTEEHERGQRIAARIAKEARLGETLTTGCDLSALAWKVGEIVTLDLAEVLPRYGGQWEIMRIAFDARAGHYRLDLRRYDSAIEDYDPTSEEQTFNLEAAA